MRRPLLAVAATVAGIAFYAMPAAAEGFGSGSHAGPFVGRPAAASPFGHDGFGRDHRGSASVLLDWYGGEWALYNNRSFAPDSYNDWWHDRPDRAYPAWMRRNQDCSRQWYSGDVLRC